MQHTVHLQHKKMWDVASGRPFLADVQSYRDALLWRC